MVGGHVGATKSAPLPPTTLNLAGDGGWGGGVGGGWARGQGGHQTAVWERFRPPKIWQVGGGVGRRGGGGPGRRARGGDGAPESSVGGRKSAELKD